MLLEEVAFYFAGCFGKVVKCFHSRPSRIRATRSEGKRASVIFPATLEIARRVVCTLSGPLWFVRATSLVYKDAFSVGSGPGIPLEVQVLVLNREHIR